MSVQWACDPTKVRHHVRVRRGGIGKGDFNGMCLVFRALGEYGFIHQ